MAEAQKAAAPAANKPAAPKAAAAPAAAPAAAAAAKPAGVPAVAKPAAAAKAAEPAAPAAGAAPAEGEQDLEAMKKKFKPKKKVALPTEMLSDAKSYDDKLILMKFLTEKEKGRVVLMIKNMLKGAGDAGKKK